MDFPGSSTGIESACNAGDPGLIPGSGRSPGERIGYPLQYSWASLVAQMIKNPPAMRETQVWSLAWEDPLEEGMKQPIPLFLPKESSRTEEPGGLQSMVSQRVGHNWATKHAQVIVWAAHQVPSLMIVNETYWIFLPSYFTILNWNFIASLFT